MGGDLFFMVDRVGLTGELVVTVLNSFLEEEGECVCLCVFVWFMWCLSLSCCVCSVSMLVMMFCVLGVC